jgi:MFS family permease
VGLVAAMPLILLAIPAGHAADRFQRKTILLLTQTMSASTSLGLAVLALEHNRIPAWKPLLAADSVLNRIATLCERSGHFHFDPGVPLMLLLLLISGTGRVFGWAARGAFMPNLVPAHSFSNAVTWNSSIFQVASVFGPAMGGFLIARFGFPAVYAFDASCAGIFFCCLLPIHAPQKHEMTETPGLRSLFSGLRFVWGTKIILATITLDLFAVLLGGATALLPIFADQILHTGAIGLGWMRAAPAVGAFAMAVVLAHHPPERAGKTLLWAVMGFGMATIVFGLSKSFWLSLLMLALTGACDNVSVVVRHSLVQLLTPDEMRGRVSAVNNVFIGSSNEIGAFESGITAALFGPVLSVVGGGIGTIAVVLAVMARWPAVARFGSLTRRPGEQ